MIFTLKDLNNNILCTGTRQECKYFMKLNKYSAQTTILERFSNKPAPHYTIPITEDSPPPKNIFKRIFG